MSESGNGRAVPPREPHRIVLTFPAEGELDVQIEAVEVRPAEVYLAAWVLEAIAREVRAGQVMGSAMRGITREPASILDELRRTGRV